MYILVLLKVLFNITQISLYKMRGKEYPEKVFRVPNTIDYDKLFSLIPDHKNDLTNKKHIKFKESIYLFLSYLYPSKSKSNRIFLNSQWKRISMQEFQDITRDFHKLVVDILTDERYPIIDVNKFFVPGVRSREYRLKKEFTKNCKPLDITIKSVISLNYINKTTPTPILKSNTTYDYLLNNYDKSIITIDHKVYDYISALETALKKKLISRKKAVQEFYDKKIDAKIKKLNNHVKNIEEGKFNAFINISNRRLYSELVYCNKELRKFILINNNQVSEVDINNSHLYVLASILHKEFFEETDKPFSLKNINDIYFGVFNDSFNKSDYYRETAIKYMYLNKTKKEEDKLNTDVFKNSLLLYMVKYLEINDIEDYKNLPFDKSLYEYLDANFLNNKRGRNYIKKNVMFFLNMVEHRSKNSLVRSMSRRFPSVDKVIEIFNSYSRNGLNLAVMLQSIESYLLLEVGVLKLLSNFPELKFITVHDAIIVEEKYAQQVKDLLSESITKETGIRIGISITDSRILEKDIEEIAEKSALQIIKSRKRTILRARK